MAAAMPVGGVSPRAGAPTNRLASDERTQMRRPTRASVLSVGAVLAGVLLIAAGIVLWHRNAPPPTNAGVLPPVAPASALPASPLTAPATPEPTGASAQQAPATQIGSEFSRAAGAGKPTPTSRPTRVETSTAPSSAAHTSARPSTGASTLARSPATASPGRPEKLELPSIGVTAAVREVDSVQGVLQVPDDVSQVGWWEHSAPAGSAVGTTVIDGHIDSAAAGAGALYRLADVSPGDSIVVRTDTGRTVTYRVQARRVYVKTQGLPADLFSQQGPGRLVVISCGGPFNYSERSYEDNIAIYATPAI